MKIYSFMSILWLRGIQFDSDISNLLKDETKKCESLCHPILIVSTYNTYVSLNYFSNNKNHNSTKVVILIIYVGFGLLFKFV